MRSRGVPAQAASARSRAQGEVVGLVLARDAPPVVRVGRVTGVFQVSQGLRAGTAGANEGTGPRAHGEDASEARSLMPDGGGGSVL